MTALQDTRIVLAAGGTGGHLFPAEALAGALIGRGVWVDLITDERGTGFSKLGEVPVHHIASGGIAGKGLATRVRNYARLALGVLQSRKLLKRLQPSVAVGFGGYPSVPPLLAAQWSKIETVIHEQNAVMGRANRALMKRASKVALSFEQVRFTEHLAGARKTMTGNPVRPAIAEIGTRLYQAPTADGPLNLLVFGGSQGARVFGRIVPQAVALLPERLRRRLQLVQQVRAEDLDAARAAYRAIGLDAELKPFFGDMPARYEWAHLVMCRSGASSVSELAAAGRPALMIPLHNAIDDHQMANADSLSSKGGGWVMSESAFTPERVAERLEAILSDGAGLARAAAAAHAAARIDAAERLADLVLGLVPGVLEPYRSVH
jgi:UDP-N-acetylglucosamine--N-acetylmuramyl-(pentapeptide) pyrophosphoryl-undecaprenol N-acetylglucosamine transferase